MIYLVKLTMFNTSIGMAVTMLNVSSALVSIKYNTQFTHFLSRLVWRQSIQE
jgi:hypothetical protein